MFVPESSGVLLIRGGRVVLRWKPETRIGTDILPDFWHFLLAATSWPPLPASFSHPLNLGHANGFAQHRWSFP